MLAAFLIMTVGGSPSQRDASPIASQLSLVLLPSQTAPARLHRTPHGRIVVGTALDTPDGSPLTRNHSRESQSILSPTAAFPDTPQSMLGCYIPPVPRNLQHSDRAGPQHRSFELSADAQVFQPVQNPFQFPYSVASSSSDAVPFVRMHPEALAQMYQPQAAHGWPYSGQPMAGAPMVNFCPDLVPVGMVPFPVQTVVKAPTQPVGCQQVLATADYQLKEVRQIENFHDRKLAIKEMMTSASKALADRRFTPTLPIESRKIEAESPVQTESTRESPGALDSPSDEPIIEETESAKKLRRCVELCTGVDGNRPGHGMPPICYAVFRGYSSDIVGELLRLGYDPREKSTARAGKLSVGTKGDPVLMAEKAHNTEVAKLLREAVKSWDANCAK